MSNSDTSSVEQTARKPAMGRRQRIARSVLRPVALRVASALLRLARRWDVQGTPDSAESGVAMLAEELLLVPGWTRGLSEGGVTRVAEELVREPLLDRMSPAQRTALLPRAVHADEAAMQRWKDIDKVVNFSWRMRTDWLGAQAAQLPPGARVLDAGAGEGQYRPLFEHTRYEAQDFAQYTGSSDAAAPETWTYNKLDYVCDIADIPVPDGSFDAVVCTEVLEHVPEPLAALRELARVTKPGGRMLLTAPLGSGMHQEPFHFYGGYSRHFWARVLPELGFGVDEIVPLRGLLSHAAQELHRSARYMALEQRLTPEQAWVMQEWLPRILHDADSAVFIEQFTVGYMVRATKRVAAKGAGA